MHGNGLNDGWQPSKVPVQLSKQELRHSSAFMVTGCQTGAFDTIIIAQMAEFVKWPPTHLSICRTTIIAYLPPNVNRPHGGFRTIRRVWYDMRQRDIVVWAAAVEVVGRVILLDPAFLMSCVFIGFNRNFKISPFFF